MSLKDKQKKQIEKATRALLGMGTAPHDEPAFTKKDLDRKFRMRVDCKGRGKVEEVAD